ncbi:hypothetical protein ABT289_03080 [Streptomyces fimicarius]
MSIYVLVAMVVGGITGGGLWAAGASPAEAFGCAAAATLLADHLLERP